ncbi:MAG: HPr family phosphocarrier protein [Emcibacteraceae bacterium]|nr:HPr family phosphocarrier protein [Emcibacteraceae bacterium]
MSLENNDTQVVTICNKRGLHARASAKFVTLTGEFDSKVTVTKDGTSVCGTSIMGLMMLAAAIGDQISIHSEGADKDVALKALVDLVEDKFGEEC